MDAKTLTLMFPAVMILIMGIIILLGKGDKLIAGYNTASQQEREQYNIKRVRLCIGGLSVIMAPILLLGADNLIAMSPIIMILSFAAIILTNTWAKK